MWQGPRLSWTWEGFFPSRGLMGYLEVPRAQQTQSSRFSCSRVGQGVVGS